MQEQINELLQRVKELEDNQSNIIYIAEGNATLTQSVDTSGSTTNVPAAYTGSKLLKIGGQFITIPIL